MESGIWNSELLEKHESSKFQKSTTYVLNYNAYLSLFLHHANGPDLDEGSGQQHDPTKRVQTRRKFITHNRVPGKTVIIKFESIESAFMCREELHWRPFPSEEYVLTEDIVMTEPRDRPLVNILFDNTVLRDRIRNWVRRDLSMSRAWIRQKEKMRGTKQT